MLFEIIHTMIWVATVMLAISGLDDLYVDLMYWVLKRRHRASLPDFSEMYDKPEKPIAVILGAWNESGVIGRTLSFAVKNLRYSNYRIFVGVYPNDQKTIDIVSEISKTDKRVKTVINPRSGPTTKADNLNCMYSAICDYEKEFGEFKILLVHDAEDFIHPRSLKLYNFLIGYKGYHGIQIPVVPIKSRLGNTIHRTYCDAFAETHTKDMIIRQEMKTFMPFSGTGMGFHRKAMYCIEKQNNERKNPSSSAEKYLDRFGREVSYNESYFANAEKETEAAEYYNNTKYKDNPFDALTENKTYAFKGVRKAILAYTIIFIIVVLSAGGLFVYAGNSISGAGENRVAERTADLPPETGETPYPAKYAAAKKTNRVSDDSKNSKSVHKYVSYEGNNGSGSKNILLKY